MKLFNRIQVIKYGIRRAFNRARVGDTAPQDIKLLSAICADVHVMTASNGGTYWYYFPNNIEDVEVAQYLMERNGVVPTFRMSHYLAGWGNRRPAFRLSRSYLLRHPKLNEFVKKIEEAKYTIRTDADVQNKIVAIRNQLNQRQK